MKYLNQFLRGSWTNIFIVFISISLLLRTGLFINYFDEIDKNFNEIVKIFAIGLIFDFITICYFSILPLLYFLLTPRAFFNSSLHRNFLRILYFVFLNIIIFSVFAEIIFFDEFQERFNFIAVDYLIYTKEVVGNIFESYPMPLLISCIIIISSFIFIVSFKKIISLKYNNFKSKLFALSLIFCILGTDFIFIDGNKFAKLFSNNYNKSLSQNGIYQFFSAFRNNEIEYEKFYLSTNPKEANKKLRDLISKQENNIKFIDDENIYRRVYNMGAEKKYNIILVTIESFSANFMSHFGNKENLTPNLDALANKSLFFTNLKATGTRTVRGLEAIALSIPPTPGNSIVRRPNNENLFNISSPLKERGYEAKFIYGGNGYFDNMNYFFENNGFKIIDRTKFSEDEISFANVWGVSDENLYDKTIKEADESYSKNKPFFNFVMTTSNHRPYTYPDGKIDIPSKTGRNGAVKYSDYAIGELIKKSAKKPWFKNTIFIFIADHCAGSAGNTDVPLWRYQIPAIFYAPNIIAPRVFTKNISQIDIAPTLLGILNLSYNSKFFGADVLKNNNKFYERAFVSTYSDLGYFKDKKLYLLKLKKELKVFDVNLIKYGWDGSQELITKNFSPQDLDLAIAYYKVASDNFKNQKLKNFQLNESSK